MRNLTFDNQEIMDILNHQVIHMDQGITYCPEYMVTRKMRHYPSRTAQIIKAVYTGEIDPSDYGADTVFSSIMSGQGERWQNFGEDPNGYMITLMLGRELFLKKGKKASEVQRVREEVANLKIPERDLSWWRSDLPLSEDSKTAVLLDGATAIYAKKSSANLGEFLKSHNKEVSLIEPCDIGFDYMAAGLIDEGIEVIEGCIKAWEDKGYRNIITLSGQSQYVFTILLKYLGIETDIEFVSILDLADSMEAKNVYVYGGSFYTRYLRKDALLNSLVKNEREEVILNTQEFLPELQSDGRRNVVGIWTPPLCAEYGTYMGSLGEEIYKSSMNVIKRTSFGKLLVCDPFAYKALKDHGYPREKMIYFLDIIR